MTHQFREGIGRNKNKMGNIDGVKKVGKMEELRSRSFIFSCTFSLLF